MTDTDRGEVPDWLANAMDLGIYPKATPTGERTPYQDGWNAASIAISEAVEKAYVVQPSAPTEGLREALEWFRGCEDSIGRFSRDPIGTVVRLDDVLALLKLAHTGPPRAVAGMGVCADCGAFWPCPYAEAAGAAYYAAHEGAGR